MVAYVRYLIGCILKNALKYLRNADSSGPNVSTAHHEYPFSPLKASMPYPPDVVYISDLLHNQLARIIYKSKGMLQPLQHQMKVCNYYPAGFDLM